MISHKHILIYLVLFKFSNSHFILLNNLFDFFDLVKLIIILEFVVSIFINYLSYYVASHSHLSIKFILIFLTLNFLIGDLLTLLQSIFSFNYLFFKSIICAVLITIELFIFIFDYYLNLYINYLFVHCLIIN